MSGVNIKLVGKRTWVNGFTLRFVKSINKMRARIMFTNDLGESLLFSKGYESYAEAVCHAANGQGLGKFKVVPVDKQNDKEQLRVRKAKKRRKDVLNDQT